MKKQLTAVEWLYERLERMIPRTSLYNIDKKEYFEQAKQIEKQNIIDAWKNGFYERDSNGAIYDGIEESIEHYYNGTFKK